MKKDVIGIRFQPVGKKYYFDPQDSAYERGEKIIVETVRGLELAEVIEPEVTLVDDPLIDTVKPVLRRATSDDIKAYEENQNAIPNILEHTQSLIDKHALTMKLLNASYTLDRSKLLIEFYAEGRVDFRHLVKDLAYQFKTRIELKQVGSRDSAKHLGGIGPCGLILCCNTFLGEFDAVSIKMAKNQNLALNPVNISGLCGKLLCCLRYEDDMYTTSRKGMPKERSIITAKEGKGKVLSMNILERTVRVYIEDKGVHTYNVDDLIETSDTY